MQGMPVALAELDVAGNVSIAEAPARVKKKKTTQKRNTRKTRRRALMGASISSSPLRECSRSSQKTFTMNIS